MKRFTQLTNHEGFTLVEIMIVVAIIALLAAIAIPNLLRARLNANETAAIAFGKTYSTAQESFRAAQTPPIYAAPGPNATAGTLTGSVPPYLNATASATAITRQGYLHTQANFDANSFCLLSVAVTNQQTGNRTFCIDSSGVGVGGLFGTAGAPTCQATTPFICLGGAALE